MTAPDLQLLEDGTTIASEELRKRYVKKILGTLPEGAFDTILFTESGYVKYKHNFTFSLPVSLPVSLCLSLSLSLSLSSSTANDLALSIAEAVTGHTQIISLDG